MGEWAWVVAGLLSCYLSLIISMRAGGGGGGELSSTALISSPKAGSNKDLGQFPFL